MSIFKDSFTSKVRDQLKARGDAFINRTPNDIIYINGRAAWARMTSGVDIGNDGGKTAKDNILQGGVLQEGGNSLRAGVGNSFLKNAYSSTTNGQQNLHGLVPMPGITSINVDSKSAYGSVRVATVNFNCWDIRQLELFEALYMRPGFILLLEWGWLPYLDNNGQIQSNLNLYDIFKSGRTGKNGKPISLQERLVEVYKQSETADANYEAILGYIKNYEWSARPDGGYDCRTEIISTGEILESLKVNYAPNYKSAAELRTGLLFPGNNSGGQLLIDPKYNNALQSLYETNIIAGLAGELIFYAYTSHTLTENKWSNFYIADHDVFSWDYIDEKGLIVTNEPINFNPVDHNFKIEQEKHSINFLEIKINTEDKTQNKKTDTIESDKQIYIPLESFINILNRWVIPIDQSGNSAPIIPLSTKQRVYDSGPHAGEDLLCLADPLQISVDPTVCLIKNPYFKGLSNINFDSPISNTVLPSFTGSNDFKYGFVSLQAKHRMPGWLDDISQNGVGNAVIPSTWFVDSDVINTFKQDIDNFITFADGTGLKDKTIVTQFIANAWEEYKYKNVNPVAQHGLTTVFEPYFCIPSSNGTEIVRYFYITDTGKQEAINYLTTLSFTKFLEDYIGEDNTKIVLGSDYGKYYKPDSIVAGAAATETRKKFELQSIKDTNTSLSQEKGNLSFLNSLKKDYFKETDNGLFGTIGNIYVNLNNIVNLSTDGGLESNDVKEKREINLYDFIKKLMGQIQGSIGSLNNFDIHADPIDGVGRIIDISYIDEMNTANAYANAFTFLSDSNTPGTNVPALNGLYNNVRSYKINSQIFKEQSSIVAISAQNGGGVMGLDNETLVGWWGKGLKNRLLLNSNPPGTPTYAQTDNQAALMHTLQNALISLLDYLVALGWVKATTYTPGGPFAVGGAAIVGLFDDRNYHTENADKYKNALRDLIMVFKALTKADSSFKAIIPTILSLELDGIGGLIIGHLFRFPDELLPAGYKGGNINGQEIGRKLGYIITKLGHKISDSDWTTHIDAQTVILEDSDKSVFNLFNVLKAASAGAKIDISSKGKIDIINPKTVPAEQTEIDLYYNTVLQAIKAPLTNGNILFLKAWHQAEGSKATWNAFNTTYNFPGSTTYNVIGVKNYPDLNAGALANAYTIRDSKHNRYQNIYFALLKGIVDQKAALNLAIEQQKPHGDLWKWVKGPNSTDIKPLEGYIVAVLKGHVRNTPIYKNSII